MKVTITGVLTTKSPLHVSAPGDAVCAFPGESGSSRFRFGSIQDPGKECTGTRTMSMRKPIPVQQLAEIIAGLPEGANKPRPYVELPIVPANTFRGILRRQAAEEICKAAKALGKFIGLGTYRGLMCGAVTGNPAGECSLPDRLEGNRHAYLGLFGGGPRLIASSYAVHDSYPLIEQAAGLVSTDHELHPIQARDLLQGIYSVRNEDLANAIKEFGLNVVEDYEKHAAEYLGNLKTEQGERAAQRASKAAGTTAPGEEKKKKSGLKSFNAREVIIPGTPMSFEAVVDTESIGNAGLGLFLTAIYGFVKSNKLGGLTRTGFGRFDANLTITGPDGVAAPFITTVNGAPKLHDTGSPLVEESLQAWAETAANLDVAQIERIFRLNDGEE